MISIDKVSNGFIVHVDEDETIVFQKEYDSMNLALGSVFRFLIKHLAEEDDITLKLDFEGK